MCITSVEKPVAICFYDPGDVGDGEYPAAFRRSNSGQRDDSSQPSRAMEGTVAAASSMPACLYLSVCQRWHKARLLGCTFKRGLPSGCPKPTGVPFQMFIYRH